jgi:hypothetical protein
MEISPKRDEIKSFISGTFGAERVATGGTIGLWLNRIIFGEEVC